MAGIPDLSGTHKQEGFNIQGLMAILNKQVLAAETSLQNIQANGEDISLGAMFQMQMVMNKMSQCSEMCTQVSSGANSAIISMTRNLKQ